MKKFLTTIFIHHIHKRYRFLNPKCFFSSLVSSSPTPPPPPEDTETLHSTNPRNESTNSWSIYGNVVGKPRISDHSEEKIEEEKPNESENGSMMNLKNRNVIRTATTPTKRGTGKVKTQWVCSNCGYTAGQWWGTCPSCTMVGTMKEFHEAKLSDSVDNNKVRSGISVSEDAMGAWLPQRGDHLRPVKLNEVNRGFNEKGWRFPL
jgi:DNA repair protein RadA/Sms